MLHAVGDHPSIDLPAQRTDTGSVDGAIVAHGASDELLAVGVPDESYDSRGWHRDGTASAVPAVAGD